jgi:hypothetical protein
MMKGGMIGDAQQMKHRERERERESVCVRAHTHATLVKEADVKYAEWTRITI